MPWTVTTPSTPLWADSKRTFKKGIVAQTTEFIVERVSHPGGLAMGKTADVMYIRKGDGMSLQGDGWIELKNCSPVPLAPAPETIQDDPAWLFLKQLGGPVDKLRSCADAWEADQKAWSETWEKFTSRIVALEDANAALREMLDASETRADGAIYLGKPTAFWYELLRHAEEFGVDKIVADNAALRERVERAEEVK